MNNSKSKIDFGHFWPLQVLFWLGLCVVTFVTLTLWYGQFGWRHITHTGLQGIFGLLISSPLRFIFNSIWDHSLSIRIVCSVVALAVAAAVWNVGRMYLFIWITAETHIWNDFGGWYFGAIYVFFCWTALYHGIQYYQLLQAESVMKLQAEATVSEEKIKRLNAQSEAKDAQLAMLRYQLNPHFLFNTLNAINALVGTENPDKAQQMIVRLSRFLRFSLDNNPKVKVSLEREIDALMLYLEIEKTRFGSRLELDFDVSSEAKLALLPSLLLQPLIENSMKYAIAKSESGGTIRLRASVNENKLCLSLSDSGTGKKSKDGKITDSGRGIGLRNTVDRLKAFYGTDYSFNLATSRSGGLKTIIELPLESSIESVD